MTDGLDFDIATSEDEDGALYLRCRELSEYPQIGGESIIAQVQSAFLAGEYVRSVEHLRKHLLDAGIDPQSRPSVNGTRLAHVRIASGIRQKNLARALGVTPKALCHLEKGIGTLRFSRVLLAAAILGIRIEQLLTDAPLRRRRYDLLSKNNLVGAHRKRKAS